MNIKKRHGLLGLLIFLVLLWLGGLIAFARMIPTRADDFETKSDAIVVLTGGSKRLAVGIDLLEQELSPVLFISGVHDQVALVDLLYAAGVDIHRPPCCIELGHIAKNTYQNAVETARWAGQNHIQSLRLVTSNYHLPRSLYLFQKMMPGITILPHPVLPDEFYQQKWWLWPGSAKIVLSEFHKYYFTKIYLAFYDLLAPLWQDHPETTTESAL